MAKVKTFFSIFWNSLIPQHTYYSHIKRNRLSFSLIYFCILHLFLIIFFTIGIFTKYNTNNLSKLHSSLLFSINDIPDNLSVTIKNGVLSTNHNKPYFFWITYQNKKLLVSILDEHIDLSQIEKTNAITVINANGVAIKLFNKKIIKFSFNESLDTFVIDKKTLFSYTNIFFTYLEKFMPITYICIFIVSLISMLTLDICLLIFIWSISLLLSRLYRKKITPLSMLKITLHASSFPYICFYVIIFFFPYTRMLPFLIFLLFATFQFSGVYETYFEED